VFLKRWRWFAPRDGVSERTCRQLESYFDDPEFRFDVPLAAQGRPSSAACGEIAAIGAGRTRSYGELARELRSAPRAVGQACGANPVPLVVPCHACSLRAESAAFAHHEAGFHLAIKRWLLAHEGAAR